MEQQTLSVSGMSCGGCEQAVENAVGSIDGVSRVDADNETGTVEVVAEDDVSETDLAAAVEDAGYDAAA